MAWGEMLDAIKFLKDLASADRDTLVLCLIGIAVVGSYFAFKDTLTVAFANAKTVSSSEEGQGAAFFFGLTGLITGLSIGCIGIFLVYSNIAATPGMAACLKEKQECDGKHQKAAQEVNEWREAINVLSSRHKSALANACRNCANATLSENLHDAQFNLNTTSDPIKMEHYTRVIEAESAALGQCGRCDTAAK